MTIREYLSDHATKGEVTISELLPGDRPIVRVTNTWFHPQGGGQKADRGLLGSSHVLHVAHNGDEVDHYVDTIDGFEVGRRYPFVIDDVWRRLNAAYHSSGHLIASVVEASYPELTAISGHQWPGEARVEFKGAIDREIMSMEDLNAMLNRAVHDNLTVEIVGDVFTSRAIKIGAFKEIPCGGTHVRHLNEIDFIRVNNIKTKGGRLRISYEATPAI